MSAEGVPVFNSIGEQVGMRVGGEYVCTKIAYVDKIAAEFAISSARMKRRRKQGTTYESRAYECPKCRKWHVTSRPAPLRADNGVRGH